MALEVEDGTGKANAESYCSVAAADTYHSNQGNTSWADLDTEVKEQSLRKATRYLDGIFVFSGSKNTREQALQWPRFNAFEYGWLLDSAVVPTSLVNACAELAFQAQTTDLAPTGAPDGAVRSESVGPLSVTYADGTSGATRFRVVDQLLRGLVYNRSFMKVTRG